LFTGALSQLLRLWLQEITGPEWLRGGGFSDRDAAKAGKQIASDVATLRSMTGATLMGITPIGCCLQ